MIALGGGFAHLTLVDLAHDTEDPDDFYIEIGEVLWNAPAALDPDLERVTLLGNGRVDPSLLHFPLEVVSLVSNDGVAWNVAAVDADGCLSQVAGIAEGLNLTPVTAILVESWDLLAGWPGASVCDDRVVPQQPERHDAMVAEFLSRVGDIDAEKARLRDIDRRADTLAHRLDADVNDIKRQLLAGVPEGDLELRPIGNVTLLIPSLANNSETPRTLVLFEGEPMEFMAWKIAGPRISGQLLLPGEGNTVHAYLGSFDELPPRWECPAAYDNAEPYAAIPAEAFLPPNEQINLDEWRP